MPRSSSSRSLVNVAAPWALALVLLGCRSNPTQPLGPADSYLLFAPEPGKSESGLPHVRRLDIKDQAVQPLPPLLESSFAFEMLRTAYLAKQFVREAKIDGRAFSPAAQRNAAEPTVFVLGLEAAPFGRGLVLPKSLFGAAQPLPNLAWIGLPAEPAADKALVQTVAGRLASFVAHFVGTGGELQGAGPPAVLADGYRIAIEVIAREWRIGNGPDGVIQTDVGTTAQREIFANVRENRYVLAGDGTSLRPARELLEDPGVAATILHRMAQSRMLAGRVAAESFYAPFASNRFPPGVSPAAVLGTFRNFQAKLLGAWAGGVLMGRAPKDVLDLVELYSKTFPTERYEAVRICVVTTFGATAKLGGVSTKPKDAERSLAELTALTAEVVAGRRSLREALSVLAGAGPAGQSSGREQKQQKQ
jgi:hypothetical protein